jgi:hypothetical protein
LQLETSKILTAYGTALVLLADILLAEHENSTLPFYMILNKFHQPPFLSLPFRSSKWFLHKKYLVIPCISWINEQESKAAEKARIINYFAGIVK